MSNKSGIHIKPENRGKFTATKKRTGKSTEELTHSKNPLTRKRAIFAQNARKWKHELGGFLPSEIPVNVIKRAYGGPLQKALFGLDLKQAGSTWMNQSPTYLMPPTSNNPGDIAYSGVMAGVSKAGPIGAAIGKITSVGDAIGTPIKMKAEEQNQYGGLENMRMAERSANVGALFNPFKAAMTTMGDKDATNREKWSAGLNAFLPGLASLTGFGKARAERLNQKGEEEFFRRTQEGQQGAYTNYLNSQIRATGGPIVNNYKGASHATGGIPVDENSNPVAKSGRPAIAEVQGDEIAWNGYVFSNVLKYKK